MREARVALDQRPQTLHRCVVHVVDQLHRVRIAHRYDDHRCRLSIEGQRPLQGRADRARGKARAVEAAGARIEVGCAHVDADGAIVLEAGFDASAGSDDAYGRTPCQAQLVHELDEAARPVAALFDLAAVGVEDAVAEIGRRVRRSLHDQYLVRADTQAPIGQAAQRYRRQIQVLTDAVQHDEVIAGALHLGKAQFHEPIIAEGAPAKR